MNRGFGFLLLCSISLALTACGSSKSGDAVSIAASSNAGFSSSSTAIFPESSSAAPLADWIPAGKATRLPQLRINTYDALPIVTKQTYLPGTFELSDLGNNSVFGELEVRGRGNSTWDWPKKPLRLKLSESVSLLGMPASKHWVLLANMADKTLIRNDIAFAFSRAIGVEYTVADRHIELLINGQYEGIYQLTEQIRLATNRINLPELDAEESDPLLISGTYLLEVDFRMANDLCDSAQASSIFPMCVSGVNTDRVKTFCFDSLRGMPPICEKDPDTLLSADREAQRSYIQTYLNDTEAALFSSSFTDVALGYAAYLDVPSVVDYYLINEFFKNVDAGTASFFMVKKREGKLHFGPVWDFDFAMGNVSYSDVHLTEGWHLRQEPWFERLFEDEAFRVQVKNRWNELKADGKFEHIFQYILARSRWLEIKQADNFDRWAMVYGQPIFEWRSWFNATLELPGSYAGEVEKLLVWQKLRYQWMDAQINNEGN